MNNSQGVSTLVAQALLRAAKKGGLDTNELLREVGVDPQRVNEPTETVPVAKEDALWRSVLARTDDPTFGLRAARALGRGALRGVEYAMRSSATLADALGLLERFSRLLHRSRFYYVRPESGGTVSLVYEAPSGEVPEAVVADFGLASIVLLLRDATGTDWSPRRVRLRHRGEGDPSAYRRVFRTTPEFDEPENSLELDAAVLATPMREPDPALRAVLERYLQTELETVDPARSLEEAVRAAIGRSLPEQESDLEAVAVQIGLSSRVLQKRLQQAGTSFQEVLDGVREAQAKRYLLQPSITLAGAALLLGYSDVTAFHRAFKRWTGVTPGDFRRKGLAERRAQSHS
jgi:AraC-like DNA-binding protein